jgi:hypothetical protein
MIDDILPNHIELPPVTPESPPFDFSAFQGKLKHMLNPSQLSLFAERAKMSILEKLGKRDKEASIQLLSSSTEEQRLVFIGENGAEFDPLESRNTGLSENSDPITYSLIDGSDFDARTLPEARCIDLPRNWLDKQNPHQGLKALHEIAHVIVRDRNPSYSHVLDEIKINNVINEYFLYMPKISQGQIVTDIQKLIDAKLFSNMGISDPGERAKYLDKRVREYAKIATRDSLLQRVYAQNTLLEYETNTQLERNVWVETLQLVRAAKRQGVIIDNRPVREQFDLIDLALATKIRPDWTHAVHHPLFRRRMGLPEHAGPRPKLAAMPVESAVWVVEKLERMQQDASNRLRERLHLSDEPVENFTVRITPVSAVDSRIIHAGDPLFFESDDSPTLSIDREMETKIKLCVIAYQTWQNNWQTDHLEKYYDTMDSAEYHSFYVGAKQMVIVGDIDVSEVMGVPGRYTVLFRAANVGQGMDPKRIESDSVYYDNHIVDIEDKPVPAHRDNKTSYLFALRTKPEDEYGYVGWQLIGERMELIDKAEAYAQSQDIQTKKMEAYLRSQGYDTGTVGEIWIGLSGSHAGYLTEDPILKDQ